MVKTTVAVPGEFEDTLSPLTGVTVYSIGMLLNSMLMTIITNHDCFLTFPIRMNPNTNDTITHGQSVNRIVLLTIYSKYLSFTNKTIMITNSASIEEMMQSTFLAFG